MEPILQVQHLTHTYSVGTPFQRSAVEDMSFDVYDGEFLGIIGHTGSGKSTLIQHLNGLLRPTSGQILLHGKDIWAEPKKIDPAGRENLMANIRDYHRNKKRTIILVSHSMDEIARNVDRILVLKSAHVLMSGTPAEVFARAEELLSAGLDVPQVTRIAMRLREQGLAIDPAVYTVEALERELLALRRGETGC